MKRISEKASLLVVVLVVVTAGLTLRSQEEPVEEPVAHVEYAGTDKCKLCHSELYNKWADTKHEKTLHAGLGASLTGCEACHGPGSKHVETTGNTDFIVNPDNMPKDQVNAICGKCHFDSGKGAPEDWKRINEKYWLKSEHFNNDVGCLQCHDIHGGKEKLLATEKNGLCATCHASIKEPADGGYVHTPVKAGMCFKCHNQHGTKERHLVVDGIGAICEQCHDVKTKQAVASHSGYSVKGAKCVICHYPHSREKKKKLIPEYSHPPFKNRQCKLCHGDPAGAAPIQLKGKPDELCLKCHEGNYQEFLKKGTTTHFPVEKKFCTGCHSPHVSRYKEMIKDNIPNICFTCHQQIEDATTRRVKHPPVAQGKCLVCHDVKGSNYPKLMKTGINEKCSSCHEKQAKQSHPVGKNLEVPGTGKKIEEIHCATCHFVHGSDHEYILNKERNDLCYTCHTF